MRQSLSLYGVSFKSHLFLGTDTWDVCNAHKFYLSIYNNLLVAVIRVQMFCTLCSFFPVCIANFARFSKLYYNLISGIKGIFCLIIPHGHCVLWISPSP